MDGRATVMPVMQPREWLLAGLLVVAFAPALAALAKIWASVDYQSHGFLVPVVALWAFYRERPRRVRLEAAPDRRGLVVLSLAFVTYLLGLAAGGVTLQGVALVAAVAGLVLYSRGVRWLRALAFPVGFLIFMVPPPSSWITPAIVRLQLLVSSASIALFQIFDLQVTREGNILNLPGGESLYVAEACSGVTSIITLAPLAVLLAHFTLKRWDFRLLLIAAVVPLAMAGNLARVVATVLASLQLGTQRATTGVLHEATGLLTYLVACGLMLALGALLRRLERPG
jgi:exosortase